MMSRRSKPSKRECLIRGCEARIEASLEEDWAQIACLSLKPDLISKSRLSVNITHDKDRLILNFEGEDISQLRAGINAYLRLIGMITKLSKGVIKKYKIT